MQLRSLAGLARTLDRRQLAFIAGDILSGLLRIAFGDHPGDPEILQRDGGLVAGVAKAVLRHVHAKPADLAVGLGLAGKADAAADAGVPFVEAARHLHIAAGIAAMQGEFVRAGVAGFGFGLGCGQHGAGAAHAGILGQHIGHQRLRRHEGQAGRQGNRGIVGLGESRRGQKGEQRSKGFIHVKSPKSATGSVQ